MKKLPKGNKDYTRTIDKDVKQKKSSLPFAIFLTLLFLGAYLFFSNVFFG